LVGQIKEDGMGQPCGIWGRNEMHTGFWWVKLKKRYNLQDLSVDGHEYILWEGVDWIHLAEDTQNW
jgi:hypothetical protein